VKKSQINFQREWNSEGAKRFQRESKRKKKKKKKEAKEDLGRRVAGERKTIKMTQASPRRTGKGKNGKRSSASLSTEAIPRDPPTKRDGRTRT